MKTIIIFTAVTLFRLKTSRAWHSHTTLTSLTTNHLCDRIHARHSARDSSFRRTQSPYCTRNYRLLLLATSSSLSDGRVDIPVASSISDGVSDESANSFGKVEGLLSSRELRKRASLHRTLRTLQSYIPNILVTSLDMKDAQSIYSDNVRLLVAAGEANATRTSRGASASANTNGDVKQIAPSLSSNSATNIELANSLTELQSLTDILVLSNLLSQNARSFLTSRRADKGDGSSANPIFIKARIILVDPYKLDRVQVEWHTDLPGLMGLEDISTMLSTAGLSPSNTNLMRSTSSRNNKKQATFRLQGLSELQISTDPLAHLGKVTSHTLLRVRWNGVTQDARAIGQGLSTLRQAVQRLQNVPTLPSWIIPPPLSSLLSPPDSGFKSDSSDASLTSPLALAESLLGTAGANWRQSTAFAMKTSDSEAPIYVSVPGNNLTAIPIQRFQFLPSTGSSSTESFSVDDPVESKGSSSSSSAAVGIPLPGSPCWDAYVNMHEAVTGFVQDTIPLLSSSSSSSSRSAASSSHSTRRFFEQKVRLRTLDGSVLLEGPDRISNFFRSLSAWRQRSFTVWELTGAKLLAWDPTTTNGDSEDEDDVGIARVQIRYRTEVKVPRLDRLSAQTWTVEGTDIYGLQIRTQRNNEMTGNVALGTVISIEQDKFTLNGDDTSQQDTIMIMRSLVTASESGRFANPNEANMDSFWIELLQRITMGGNGANSVAFNHQQQQLQNQPLRSDKVAAASYRIMLSLHREIPSLFSNFGAADRSSSLSRRQNTLLPPLYNHLADNVRLEGYFQEPLLRGKSQYTRTISTLLASIQAALNSGRLILKRPPQVQVELLPTENIRCTERFNFQILPLAGLPTNLLALFEPSKNLVMDSIRKNGVNVGNNNQNSIPLQMELVSDYTICPDTGMVLSHQLVESRINGQLTPGDVLSKWILSQQRGKGKDTETGGFGSDGGMDDWWLRTATDLLGWVRSTRNGS